MVEAQWTAAFFTGSSFPKPSLLSTSPKQEKQLAKPKLPQLLEKVIMEKTKEERKVNELMAIVPNYLSF